jgi:phosphoribosylaminoimidazole-succinocarboxamide synthase
MEKLQLLYEGKAKRVYETTEEDKVWIEYKDDATAFNGEKTASISGKARLNNTITSTLFKTLTEAGIQNHFVQQISDREQIVRKVDIIPLEVVVRNVVAGSLANRLGLKEGLELPTAILEFFYKNDELADPLMNEDHIHMLNVASRVEVERIRSLAFRVNEVLKPFFAELGIRLIDFKLEYGKLPNGDIVLADEISPDTCRLWDMKTNQKLDKDVFRRNLGSLTDAYEEILNRLSVRL